MNLADITCPKQCNNQTSLIYSGPIRAGGATSELVDGYSVLRCRGCGLAWLYPVPDALAAYYGDSTYWSEHHGTKIDVARIRAKLDHEQPIWLNRIGHAAFRDRIVADFGCGAALFFDHIGGLAARCVGLDLAQTFAKDIESRGYEFMLIDGPIGHDWADVAVSFDTLEHVREPWSFLELIFQVLAPGGRLFLGVPNFNDFLKQLVPKYLPFFYHKSHIWYFDDSTLVQLVRDAGFTLVHACSVHKYDLNNMLMWARDHRPTGKSGSSVFDLRTDKSFIDHIERQGIGSHLLITAQKPAAKH